MMVASSNPAGHGGGGELMQFTPTRRGQQSIRAGAAGKPAAVTLVGHATVRVVDVFVLRRRCERLRLGERRGGNAQGDRRSDAEGESTSDRGHGALLCVRSFPLAPGSVPIVKEGRCRNELYRRCAQGSVRSFT